MVGSGKTTSFRSTTSSADYGTELTIKGSQILEVSCRPELDGRARITVRTTRGDIFLRALGSKDLESPVEIGFAARPEDP